jgi:hypothetical protein
MANGQVMDDAELKALKSLPVDEKLDYVVTCTYEVKKAIEAMPDLVSDAIAQHRLECRAVSKKQLCALFSLIGACVGLATPYILAIIN